MARETPVWRFVPIDLCLPHGDGRKIVEGETLSVTPPIIICNNGLHGSKRFTDAISYVSTRPVRLTAATLYGKRESYRDKIAAQHCRTDRILTEKETILFCRRWLLNGLHRFLNRYPEYSTLRLEYSKLEKTLKRSIISGRKPNYKLFQNTFWIYNFKSEIRYISNVSRYFLFRMQRIEKRLSHLSFNREMLEQSSYANDLWEEMFE